MATADELAHAWRAAASTDAAPATLGDDLAVTCAELREAMPGLALDDVAIASALGRHGEGALAHATDLALATLAARGERAAIESIEARHDAVIGFACRRFSSRDHSMDDLRQILRTTWYVAPENGRPKIADYGGRGSLANWLRITAVRTCIDLIRRKDRTREALGAESLPEPIAPVDLALDAIKAEHREVVASALRDAILSLPSGTRHLLREHLVIGASIDQVGAALGLHRATAARRIAHARDELIRETRRLVASRLELDDRQLDDVCGLVVSTIDLSLRGLLATPSPGGS